MAVMKKEQKDIANLGPIDIVRESVKIYKAHGKVFLLIQATLMLPLALLVLAANYYLASSVPMPPGVHNGRRLGFVRFSDLRGAGRVAAMGALLPTFMILLATNAYSLVLQLAVSLAQSTSIYSVGLHYAGHPVSYLDVLRAATPRLWIRMAVTNVWLWGFSFAVSVVQALCTAFLSPGKVPVALALLGTLVWVIVLVVAGFCVNIIFMVAPGVSVLEGEDYGWAAVGKSVKLLEGKKMTAFVFRLVWSVPTTIEVGLGFALIYQLDKPEGFSASTGALFVLSNVVYLAWMMVAWQLQFLCSGIQYVSFKAFHNESLADPLSQFKSKMKGGYVRVGDGSDAAMFDGNQADNAV